MKLRNQFVLAFLLLAVAPLAVVVLYSFYSSQAALRRIVEAEAEGLTGEMEQRMAAVRLDLARRVSRVGELPLGEMATLQQGDEDGRRVVIGRILDTLGEAAPFVRSLELAPRPGAAPTAPSADVAAPNEVLPPPEHSGLLIWIDKIVDEIGTRIGEHELTAEEEEALAEAGAGVAAAAMATEEIGHLAARLGASLTLPPPPADAPVAEGQTVAGQTAAWEAEWEAQQEEWQSRFHQWEVEMHEASLADPEPCEDGDGSWPLCGEYYVPLREQGEVVGAVRARISTDQVLRGVLARTRKGQGEVPFALDCECKLYTLDEEDRIRLAGLALTPDAGGKTDSRSGDWVVATSEDPATGLSYGIARPIGDSLAEMRKVALRNFVFGLVLVVAAVFGMRPVSRRMTDSLRHLNEGVDKIGRGDLAARVEVRSGNEIGQLATAFNRMAAELEEHRAKLIEQERRRRSQEVETRLLEAEFARKSDELEEARRFQLSLLPDRVPEHAGFELAVKMETATEVGGDYYDFRLEDDGVLTCAVGDATGHGARAGTMVTVVKSLFSLFTPDTDLDSFLSEAGLAVRRMNLGRMAMAMTLVQLRGRNLLLSAAGMPPAILHRAASGEIEELLVEGMPLGGVDTGYRQISTRVGAGDTLLLLTDGLPELPDAAGEPFGYPRVERAFAEVARARPEEIVAALERRAAEWTGGGPPNDDMTFVVLRIR